MTNEVKEGIDVHFSDTDEGTMNLNQMLHWVAKPFLIIKVWATKQVSILFWTWNPKVNLGVNVKLYDPQIAAMMLRHPDFQRAIAEAANVTGDPTIIAVAGALRSNVC